MNGNIWEWCSDWYGKYSAEAQRDPKGAAKSSGGMYDKYGNSWESYSDWDGSFTAEAQRHPKGETSGAGRVFRGGSWYAGPQYCRSALRSYYTPLSSPDLLGFRLARNVP